jgi:hypothetical protein
MSFRLADLKKSVRKRRDGHSVTPARLEGRGARFQIDFILQQFEQHLGQPRRRLDPELLLDFVGDARLGRGLLAALSQWYRMRSRTFAEALARRYPRGGWQPRLVAHGIHGAVELRAWLYHDANRGDGYLDPNAAAPFWDRQAHALGLRPEEIQTLIALDHPDEAVLVRTGPRPAAGDVLAAYNARAHTTLLRSASEVVLHCAAPHSLLNEAGKTWAGWLGVECQVDGDRVRLTGRADAHGSWTRHGRRVERAALEMLWLPDLQVREVRGWLLIGERTCRFGWESELALLGAGRGTAFDPALPERAEALLTALRRERDRHEGPGWSIRQPAHLVAAAGAVCLPHLELRRGDLSVYLRLGDHPPSLPAVDMLAPFAGKTPVGLALGDPGEPGSFWVQFAGEEPEACVPGRILAALSGRADRWEAAASAGAIQPPRRIAA